MPNPEHPMLPYLVDLESRFDVNAFRPYEPVELVRYALGTSDYWADLALGWLEEGVPGRPLVDELEAFAARATDRKRSGIAHDNCASLRWPTSGSAAVSDAGLTAASSRGGSSCPCE